MSGDARRCLDICRRAVEIVDSRSKKKGTALVGMSHVDEALQDIRRQRGRISNLEIPSSSLAHH